MSYIRKNRVALIKKYILIVTVLVSILILSAAGYAYKKTQTGYRADIVATGKIAKNDKPVVRAKSMVSAGEIVDITKYETVNAPDKLVPPNAVLSISELEGKRIKNSLYEREIVLASDVIPANSWYEEGDRLVEHNFTDGAIPASVASGSMIDIKLFRQGAEDSVVISKAVVISRNANLLAFYFNAVEQENIKEAATEGVLFAVEYIDTSQEPSQITYIPAYRYKRVSTLN